MLCAVAIASLIFVLIWPQILLDLKSQLTEVQIKQDQMDINLKQLMNNNGPLRSEKKDDNGRDRARLKERMKKASLKGTDNTLRQGRSWLESIFGITHGDRRVGKERSRYLSRFS